MWALPIVGLIALATVWVSMEESGSGSGAASMSRQQNRAKDVLGYEPEVQAVPKAEGEVNGISSRVLDWMGVRGQVTEPSAAAHVCRKVDPDFETYYVVNHPWSVFELKKGTFDEAMDNLRRTLPDKGWKITKDGPMDTKAASPEIIAVQPDSHHTLTVQWLNSGKSGRTELISVDVDSRCFRVPEGTELNRS
ncbi:hypothetical protein SAMN05421870_108290 [Streptomyces qinglanensis]|uniref:Uncharacterized protein n=3 Tax=Streptomyces qinglanensis TaxID=943816 RepID=A0A1H9UL49_9ACTN|nr:hypothetical protein SAMN05421870_108290 [Streptomyces qinglanensis]